MINNTIDQCYDIPQIRLRDLLDSIPHNNIQELWEVSYIASKSSTPHFVVILGDSTLLCTCMAIINQGLLCRHQYRIFLQSNIATFHISLLHTRWFNSIPTNTTNFVTIVRGEKNSTNIPLIYIKQMRSDNVYTPVIREHISKKIKFGTAMSVAKTSIQIAVMEDATAELIGILTQFIMKYRGNTGLNTVSGNLQGSTIVNETTVSPNLQESTIVNETPVSRNSQELTISNEITVSQNSQGSTIVNEALRDILYDIP